MKKAAKIAAGSFIFNIAFAIYHLANGILSYSWWLLTLGTYYLLLGAVRFFVLKTRKKNHTMTKFTGSMLILLSVPLAGTVILAVLRDRGRQLPLVPMLIMAIYAFTKITLATCKLFKLRRCCSARLTALKYISFADAFVSIFALQRSMLVSFGEMGAADILRFNLSTGTAVWLLVLFLGIRLLLEKDRSKKED